MSAVLEAKDAIRELMATYAMALDACRFADVAACFAPDGEWTTDYGAARGPAEIEAFIKGIVPVKGEGPQRKHYITNSIITVDGDRASALSDYLVVRESESGLMPVMGGTYKDKFVKTSAGWRFARKELVHHIKGDMALKNGR
jgi:3-phenylpropionate/cinnamic acid dioxygenase small subunit